MSFKAAAKISNCLGFAVACRDKREIAGALSHAGSPAVVAGDILARAWRKLVVNASINALGAVWRVPNGRLLDRDRWTSVQVVVAEAARKYPGLCPSVILIGTVIKTGNISIAASTLKYSLWFLKNF